MKQNIVTDLIINLLDLDVTIYWIQVLPPFVQFSFLCFKESIVTVTDLAIKLQALGFRHCLVSYNCPLSEPCHQASGP